jgi:hypothetical protein
VTKKFQSPFNTPTLLDGDQNSSVAQEGKWGMIFLKFQNDGTSLLVIEKISVAIR